MPDVVSGKDPIVAWRGWGLMHPHYLVSGNLVYEPRKRHEARCIKSHLCPDEGCTCGIYAFTSMQELRQQGYHKDTRYRVFGEVYLWGKVVEHAKGFRAQYSYPKNFLFPAVRPNMGMDIDVVALAPYVSYLYGVPHEVIQTAHPLIAPLPPIPRVAPVKGLMPLPPMGRKKIFYTVNPAMKAKLHTLPPQARMLYTLIDVKSRVANPVSEQDFINDLYAAAKAGHLKTRQDPWRIWAYYKPRLVADGFVTIIKK